MRVGDTKPRVWMGEGGGGAAKPGMQEFGGGGRPAKL